MDAIKNTKYCIPLSILQKVRLVHPVKKIQKQSFQVRKILQGNKIILHSHFAGAFFFSTLKRKSSFVATASRFKKLSY